MSTVGDLAASCSCHALIRSAALPKFFEADGVRISDIYAPPGWDLLKDGTYHGVYPEAIVRSSYRM